MENLFSNVKPKTKDLYFANLKRLNGGKDIDINNLDFLEDLDKVFEFLNDKYAKTTIRSYYIAICSLLSELPKYKYLYDKYYPILISQNKALETNNTKSEKQIENWITQEEVELKRLEYEMAANTIIENGAPFRQKDWTVILDWMLISLYTLIPPRRILDFCEMNVVSELKDIPETSEVNYYVISDKKFIFTNYKTAGTYKTQTVDVPDELALILEIYLDTRNINLRSPPNNEIEIPLLVDHKGNAIRENYTITKHLNNVFDGKKISVDMLRNIYLTTNFKDNLVNLKETATKMGTSPEVIQNHYVKLDEDKINFDEPPPKSPKKISTRKAFVDKKQEAKFKEYEIQANEIYQKFLKDERLKKKASKKKIITEEED
jgi:hypothetical protein